MEHNIVVGAIVGLATASTLYIYKSNNFNTLQKTILLICIIFPPVQWLGILLVLAYNNYIESKLDEKVTERKVEQNINILDLQNKNLKDLKVKGILTEEEYNTKVEKIIADKKDNNLKNSTEFKQLKSLLDSGILTTEEFNNKLELLSNISNKENSTQTAKGVVKKANEKHTTIYIIFSIIIIFILIGGAFFLSNNENHSKVNSNYYEPKIVDTKSTYQNNYQETIKNKKYVYVVSKIEKPILDVFKSGGYTNSLGIYEIENSTYSINYETETYVSEIIEINDYNTDEKYKILDETKEKLKNQMIFIDETFFTNLLINCKDENKRKEFKKIRSRIKDSKIFEFNSYSEASIHKQNNTE